MYELHSRNVARAWQPARFGPSAFAASAFATWDRASGRRPVIINVGNVRRPEYRLFGIAHVGWYTRCLGSRLVDEPPNEDRPLALLQSIDSIHSHGGADGDRYIDIGAVWRP